jgi:hypothetical protein
MMDTDVVRTWDWNGVGLTFGRGRPDNFRFLAASRFLEFNITSLELPKSQTRNTPVCIFQSSLGGQQEEPSDAYRDACEKSRVRKVLASYSARRP